MIFYIVCQNISSAFYRFLQFSKIFTFTIIYFKQLMYVVNQTIEHLRLRPKARKLFCAIEKLVLFTAHIL